MVRMVCFNYSGAGSYFLDDLFKGYSSLRGKFFIFFSIPFECFHKMKIRHYGDIVNLKIKKKWKKEGRTPILKNSD